MQVPYKDISTSMVLAPDRSTSESLGELEVNRDHSALSRYRRYGGNRHLEHPVQEFEQALSPMDHPCHATAESNLALAKGTDTSFQVPLDLYSDSLASRAINHRGHPSMLIHLAALHFVRFDQSRHGLADPSLHETISLGTADGHENRGVTLMLQLRAGRRVDPVQQDHQSSQVFPLRLTARDLQFLAIQLFHRFERFGDLADLEQAIIIFRELVRYTSLPDYRYCERLGNLAVALLLRFKHLGESSDIRDAIFMQKAVADLTPHGHPDKPLRLNNLGISLKIRFEHFGEPCDLEDAISMLKDAVDLMPRGHPSKYGYLDHLGSTLKVRFSRFGKVSDLEDAISALREAVHFTPHSDSQKPGHLEILGNSFRARFESLGELSDLEDAVSALGEAVDLTPHGHPRMPSRLNNLSIALLARFECLGELNDLEDVILMLRRALDLTPRGHRAMPARLDNLGNSFICRFEHLGQLRDLEDAVSKHRDAVNLTPHGDPRRPIHLNNLGRSLRIRFQRLGNLNDLEDAVLTLRDAVSRTPDDHPDKPIWISNLAISLKVRFERVEELDDLEEAISMLRHAVELTPHGCPDKLDRLNALGNSFLTRFQRLGEPVDLDAAISVFRDIVDLTPHDHPRRPTYLNNFSASTIIRFERIKELNDLDHAISMLRQAAKLTSDYHPEKPSYLNNLGDCFYNRFKHLGEQGDLDDAISRKRDAVDLTPRGHPHMPAFLRSLGNSFIARFEHLGELRDLRVGISILRHATKLTPNGHPEKPVCLGDLGDAMVTRFELLGAPSDLERAISLYSHAASAPLGPVTLRFRASKRWISCARHVRHRSLLRAFSVAMHLLPQLAWIGLSLSHRYSELTQGADMVREAAAAALDAGLPETAVEWLERGRSIVWGELFQLRSSYDALSSAHPDYARRLRELSTALDQASAAREKSPPSSLSEPGHPVMGHTSRSESLRRGADSHRARAIERDKLLQNIRRLPGFEGFLRHKPFSQLRASAHAGPVVILNAAERRCDALIVLADVDHVLHIPLPNFTLKRSANLRSTLKSFVRLAREGHAVKLGGTGLESLLSPLWKCVVQPVLQALAFSTPVEDLRRVFWCPTGPLAFLPIHAAGFYDADHAQPGHKVFDFVVSSYVPTLAILALPPNCVAAPSDELRVLAIPQPPSDGLSYLPGVSAELEHIMAVIRNSPSARSSLVETSVGTVEDVLDLMKDADWAHFACHGVQDGVDSGLCLADGRRLKLRNVIALSRPRGGLAFLSACQTAKGEERLSDEAIHIAAGMLLAGYEGVIGTMWSISDRLAPVIAREVYEYLFRSGSRPDHREAARALHEAIKYVRENGVVSHDEWVPFIHVGL